MINANELRIGNFVSIDKVYSYDKEVVHKVESICLEGIKVKYAGWEGEDPLHIEPCIYNEQMSGIPLTPEILERCGFEQTFTSSVHRRIDYSIDRLGTICIYNHENQFFANGKLIVVKFVHQLQNLYFALTGEELNINL